MLLNEIKLTTLKVTRYAGQSLSFSNNITVSVGVYSVKDGKIEFIVSDAKSKKDEFHRLFIGESLSLGSDVTIRLTGYALESKRIAINITAPKSIKITRD